MIFLCLALIPLSSTTKSLFEDFDASASGSGSSSNFLGDSLSPDPFLNDLAPSTFTTSNAEALAPSDWANSGDLFTIFPDDSSASLFSSSPSIFDDASPSPELFAGPSAGDSGFTSSDIFQPTDLLNPTIASSESNLIAQGATDPGMATEYDVAQLIDPNALTSPELRQGLQELLRINSQDRQRSSEVCPAPWQRQPECPPGKFPFCCLDGPPERVPAKKDRRGECVTCGFAHFHF